MNALAPGPGPGRQRGTPVIAFIVRRLIVTVLPAARGQHDHVRHLLPGAAAGRADLLRAGLAVRRAQPVPGRGPRRRAEARLRPAADRAVRPVREGHRGRRPLRRRAGQDVLPAAVLRLLIPQPAAGVADADEQPAGDRLAGVRGSRAVAGGRYRDRRDLRAAARHALRPLSPWGSRWPGCRCRSSSPA